MSESSLHITLPPCCDVPLPFHAIIEGLPLMSGDKVRARLFGSRTCDFMVEDTIPDGVVLVSPATLITVKAKAGKIEKAKMSYEDVGGLDTQIQGNTNCI